MTGRRWQVGLAGTLALVGVGLVFADSTLLAAAAVPLTYVCYDLLSRLSGESHLHASRTLEPPGATPGERVRVTLTVENRGETVLPDVRIADGLPDLTVVDGSPRQATTLGPEEAVTVTYTVVARRGEHEFDPPSVRLRSLAASSTVTRTVAVSGDTTLTCRNPERDPVAESVLRQAGQRSADETGESSEFYATREYRRGDPMRRIDWRHVARTGEFVTVQYRDQQVARTALVVDVRPPNRARPVSGHPSGATLAVDIAERLLAALDESGTLAGAGAVGLDPESPVADAAGTAWTGGTGAADPSAVLDTARAVTDSGSSHAVDPGPGSTAGGDDGAGRSSTRTPARADGRGPTDRAGALVERLPPNAQVVLCTPLLDDWALGFARAVTREGHALAVVSPDPTGVGGPGTRLAAVRRDLRLRRLDGIAETVDWQPGSVTDRQGVL